MISISRNRVQERMDTPKPLHMSVYDIPSGRVDADYLAYTWPNGASFERHQCIDESHKKRGGKYVNGGPLDISHVVQRVEPVSFSENCGSSYRHTCEGVLYPSFAGVPIGYVVARSAYQLSGISETELRTLGTSGWARYRPGRPKVALSTSIVELRDLPRMLKQRLSDFRGYSGTGKAYLSYKFGWEALVRDIRSMYELYLDIDKRLDAIIKHNGKWSLHGGPVSSTASCVPYSNQQYGFYPSVYGDVISSNTPSVGIARQERTVWFEGRFRYYIPERELRSKIWRRNTIRKMYGLTLTPDHAWNLIPWSWLIDYFTNAGDCFSNLSGGYVDAVAKYAYVMATTKHTVSQRSTIWGKSGKKYSGMIESEVSFKQRRVASPFGFGMTSGNLSDGQNLILAALGISKLKF